MLLARLILATLTGCAGPTPDEDTGFDLAAASGRYSLTLDGASAGEMSLSFSSDGTEVVTSLGDGERGGWDGATFRVAFQEGWSVSQSVDGELESSEQIESLVYEATFVETGRFEGVHTSAATCEGIHCEDEDAWDLRSFAFVGVRQ